MSDHQWQVREAPGEAPLPMSAPAAASWGGFSRVQLVLLAPDGAERAHTTNWTGAPFNSGIVRGAPKKTKEMVMIREGPVAGLGRNRKHTSVRCAGGVGAKFDHGRDGGERIQ